MYGLVLQSFERFVKSEYGSAKWKTVKEKLEIGEDAFKINDNIPEGKFLKFSKSAKKVLGLKDEEFFDLMGAYFIQHLYHIDYNFILQKLGRNFREFFLNLDNLHEYLKMTFPLMKPPSFFIAEEDKDGMELEYRSKRRGLHFYAAGSIKEISKNFAEEIKKMELKMKKQEVRFDSMVTTFEMKFDNQGYLQHVEMLENKRSSAMPLKAVTVFQLFPFSILFTDDLTVKCFGVSLRQIIPSIVGEKLTSWFELVRPVIEFSYEAILTRLNSIFELATQEDLEKLASSQGGKRKSSRSFSSDQMMIDDMDMTLHIKGQMLPLKDWNCILFIASPILKDLANLVCTGLFAYDLSMHDFSREMMFVSVQRSCDMKIALLSLNTKAEGLRQQKAKIDGVLKRTKEMVDNLLPAHVAEKIASGSKYHEVCQIYENVSILFSDIVSFTVMCSKLDSLQVVNFLNNIYTLFDFLCDQNGVFKVETVGDAYLIVGGMGNFETNNHSILTCNMALDMMDGLTMLKNPVTGEDIQMRIGVHTGSVVAGIVGLKMPRYCVFGANVGITEKLESSSMPMKIHISEACQKLLPSQFKTEERTDRIVLEKLGGLKSFFLVSKDGRPPLKPAVIKALLPKAHERPKVAGAPIEDKKEEKEDKKKAKEDKKAKADDSKAGGKDDKKPKADDNPKEVKKAESRPDETKTPIESGTSDDNPEAGADASENVSESRVEGEQQQPKEERGEDNEPGTAQDSEPEAASNEEPDEVRQRPSSSPAGQVEIVGQTRCCAGLKKSAVCAIL